MTEATGCTQGLSSLLSSKPSKPVAAKSIYMVSDSSWAAPEAADASKSLFGLRRRLLMVDRLAAACARGMTDEGQH